MKTRLIHGLAVVALAGLASPAAFAQAYAGGGIGVGHASVGCGVDLGLPVTCSKSNVAGKVYGGYTLPGTDIAVEVAYVDFGNFKSKTGAPGQAEVKASAWGVGAVWRPQFGPEWGATVRAGVAQVTGKTDYDVGVLGTPLTTLSGSQSKSNWQPTLGLGATYALAPNLRLVLDWDATRLSTQAVGRSASATVHGFTLGASFGF